MPSLSLTGALSGAVLAAAFVAAPAEAQAIGPAQTNPILMARGLIVELKSAGAATPNLQTPQAMRDRLTVMARTAGLPAPDTIPRRVGTRGYLLRFAAPLQGAALDAAMQNIAADPTVQSVSPDVRMHRLDTLPNDPNFTNGNQWYLRTTKERAGGTAALNASLAWDVTTGQNSPVVAVVDSGALFGHLDLASQFLPGYDFISDEAIGNTGLERNPDASDPGDWVSRTDLHNGAFAGCQVENSSWHGSLIAGIIAAASNNGIGVAGIDWNAKILPVRVSGKCGAWLSDIIDGMTWASGGSVDGVPDNPTPARIINISLGADKACEPAYQSAIDEAVARGALVVVAAGNTNTALGSPAGCAGVLAVGAVRQDGLKTFYSSFGAGTGLMAPGGANESALPNDMITSTSNTGTQGPLQDMYTQVAGTSFAAPMAAGTAALLLAIDPSLTPDQLIALLQQSARAFPNNPRYPVCRTGINTACNCTPQTCGAGLLDVAAAVRRLVNPGSDGNPDSGDGTDTGSQGNNDNGNSNSGQGGGGTTGWLWGLGLWSLAAAALWRRRKATFRDHENGVNGLSDLKPPRRRQ